MNPSEINQAMTRAVRLHMAGEIEPAEAIYRQILQINPNHHAALHNLGEIQYRLRFGDLGISLVRKAISVAPSQWSYHSTLGVILLVAGDATGSEAACREALRLTPDAAGVIANLGNARVAQGHHLEAVELYRRAIQIDTNLSTAHDGLGLTLLMLGRLQEGWREQEWRWRKPGYEARRFADRRQWDGSPLYGKSILLMVEQGYGDVFQFCRYASLLAARGARVVVEVVEDIERLIRSAPGVHETVIAGREAPPTDFVCPLMTVPLFFGTSLETIPASVPYLFADESLIAEWRPVFQNERRLKIGIAWAGRPTHSNDAFRSMNLRELAPLFDVPGTAFYSLQTGRRAEDLAGSGLPMVDLAPKLTDFNQTAAAIAHLDLVIAVDTAVVHLAGAMKKPVWTLLPLTPDWRWMLNRDDSPWYPTMKLYRQAALGKWAPVVNRVSESLRNMARR